MEIELTTKFRKELRKSGKKVQLATAKRIALFQNNQFHPTLNNHKLTGRHRDCRSINITGDWRAIFLQTKTKAKFLRLGTHSQLYK